MRHVLWKLVFSCLIGACALDVVDSTPEGGEVGQGDLASKRALGRASEELRAASPVDHGPLWFGTRVQADITKEAPLHAFSIEIGAPAQLALTTQGSATGPDVDTVMSLYREGRAGSSTLLSSNDDHAGTVYSALTRKLSAGRYRVEVRGKRRGVQGPFVLEAQCTGLGCKAPEPRADCIFGDRAAELGRVLRVSAILSMTSASELPDALARDQLLLAAQGAATASVATPEELFGRVDQGLVRWFRLWDDRVGSVFRGFEFRLGDASYGAILRDGGLEVVARIVEGRFQACQVPVAYCRLGETYRDLRASAAFELLAASVVDVETADQLTALAQEQLVSAVQVAYEEVSDLPSALAAVDQGLVNRVLLRELGTDSRFAVYEYGAGDNSYGAVFPADSIERVARINDGDLLACSVLQ